MTRNNLRFSKRKYFALLAEPHMPPKHHFLPPIIILLLPRNFESHPKNSKNKKPKAIELPQSSPGVRLPPPTLAVRVREEGIPAALYSQQPSVHLAPLLIKHKSWSPDAYRDEVWVRRKDNHDRRIRRSKSVTDEDLDELKACIELGFGFDSPDMDHGLSDTLPALGLYYAVNKHYHDTVSNSSSSLSVVSSTASECDSLSSVGSPHPIFRPGENPQTVKTRLRQWAQVVACSLRQSSC